MLHRLFAAVVTLTLLTQAFVPASAAVSMAARTAAPAAAAHTDAAMPCHGAAAEAAPALAPMPAMDCCGDGGDCGQCSAGCLSTPGLPVETAVSAPSAAGIQRAGPLPSANLRAPPQERLRPPINLTC